MNKNKYRNVSQTCAQDHFHHSKLEATYCNQLAVLKNAGEIKDYTTQVKYEFIVNGIKITTHKIDFEVINNDGEKELHEVKGYRTYDYVIKRRLYEACYPDLKFYEIR